MDGSSRFPCFRYLFILVRLLLSSWRCPRLAGERPPRQPRKSTNNKKPPKNNYQNGKIDIAHVNFLVISNGSLFLFVCFQTKTLNTNKRNDEKTNKTEQTTINTTKHNKPKQHKKRNIDIDYGIYLVMFVVVVCCCCCSCVCCSFRFTRTCNKCVSARNVPPIAPNRPHPQRKKIWKTESNLTNKTKMWNANVPLELPQFTNLSRWC